MKKTTRSLVFGPVGVGIVLVALILPRLASTAQEKAPIVPKSSQEAGDRVAVVFTGGYEIDPRDKGRPVVLIAAALDVSSDVFREAFRGVTPAGGGRGPTEREAKDNKSALLKVLGPKGITNDRLDTVSNYYRYNRGKGETWKHIPAEAFATVRNGEIIAITITRGGSGYSSVPKVSIPSVPQAKATATVVYGTDFKTNGSIKSISLDGAK